MYGLVNKAIEDLVVNKFGDHAWDSILEVSKIDVDYFMSMQSYSDDITYKLVGAAVEVLELPADTILEKFGEYWILYTAEQGYGAMLDMAGTSLSEFLKNLNQIHAQVASNLPELVPPRFEIEPVSAKETKVHYFSDREGLTAMMIGLLKGLSKRFNVNTHVECIQARSDCLDHDIFLITVQ